MLASARRLPAAQARARGCVMSVREAPLDARHAKVQIDSHATALVVRACLLEVPTATRNADSDSPAVEIYVACPAVFPNCGRRRRMDADFTGSRSFFGRSGN